MNKKHKNGFTLIELLIAISIIGVLTGISIFGLSSSRETTRDSRRKSDLELIRSGLEIYKADCNSYPATLPTTPGSSLSGTGASSSCALANKYISTIPTDPTSTTRKYSYLLSGTNYSLCASLEQAPSVAMDVTTCATCTTTCNYIIKNP